MKSFEKYIEENKAQLDTDRPDEMVWNNIRKELHPEKRRNLAWLKIAAVGLVLMGTAWYFTSFHKEQPKLVDQNLWIGTGWHMDSTQQGGFTMGRSDQDIPHVNYNAQVDYIYEPPPPPPTNNSGDLTLSATGGTGLATNQSFMWSNADVGEYEFSHDLNPGYYYSTVTDANGCVATDQYFENIEPKIIKRKVLRGGSWKDIDYYLNTGNRTYEYQDNNKSYVGYRNVMSYLGRGGVDYNVDDVFEYYPEEIGSYYEQYDEFEENEFIGVKDEALSTFSIDVDGAGYSNLRRFISNGFLPPRNAVKLEEMVNYFNYQLPEPTGEHPFSISTELGKCPWNTENKLLQVAIKGKSIDKAEMPANNLVFLIDVSGSMSDYNKLPLLKKGFRLLVDEMREEDRVSIVVYAGAAGVVLPPTSGKEKGKILEALENLNAGGSTAGGEGIELAYNLAQKNIMFKGNNRIILATDGDFNVGISSDDELVKLIEEKRKTGIYLSVLGLGEGNLQSSKMEKLADNGNGNYSYIDNIMEAKKVFVNEMGGTLLTIAKDVKLQLEFNPANVESYRLLGYENRMLTSADFADDTKDAGELGSGHTVVALYEIVPAKEDGAEADELKYQKVITKTRGDLDAELVTVSFRYKPPMSNKSKLITKVVKNQNAIWHSNNFKFASAVAEFGMLIRDSEYKADASFTNLINRARYAKGSDLYGYRAEFIRMAEQGQLLMEEYLAFKEDQSEE